MIATRGMNFKIATYRGTVGNISFTSPSSLTTHLHPRVNRIVCVSNAVRNHIIQMNFLGKKIPTDQVVAIYKGHDISWYRQPPANLSEFKLPKNSTYTKGKTWPAEDGATNIKRFNIYRWNQDDGENLGTVGCGVAGESSDLQVSYLASCGPCQLELYCTTDWIRVDILDNNVPRDRTT
jgi:hypothetical protein